MSEPGTNGIAVSETATQADPKVRVEGATRVYRSRRGTDIEALAPVDLSIGQGEFVSVVGPSGCGKSTLLRIVGGLVRPTDGQVLLRHDDPARQLCATVFQDYSIFPWRTVAKNVSLGLDAQRLGRDEIRQRVTSWLGRVGLDGFANAYPRQLSGGMKQRVALARALAVEPEILLMDEPFAALDAQLRTLLQEQLLRICEEERRTVLFITHSLEEAILLSDRVVLLTRRPGRIKAEFTVDLPRPRSMELRGHPEFGRLENEIWDLLRDEVEDTVQGVAR
ncbi:MAG: ABC transporter ATP-binding protein [Actinomycetota bacterium]|nr:ABC transporter ATP-binding protein [Actinomycetota bacterium]